MRKSMFLMLVLSLCSADFAAFAATARGNARGTAVASNTATATQAAAPVAARAGARQKVVSNNTATANNTSANGNVSARAGKKQTVKATPNTTAAAPTTAKPMAARAGATQKVINTGQKVTTATTNTAVPQECQDAFYGCMDSFCMLDNASGGRCQCNDRIVELDKVLEDILKLDEQSYIMATEGVERIQMGEAEEQIMARAKAAADKVTLDEKNAQDAEKQKQKVRQLDLSAWNTNIFSESDDDDIFGSVQETSDPDVVDTFADKKGNELYKSAAKMCVAIVPEQCQQYSSMVQLVYAQKIKSDCAAYENSLKQQKNASAQKLQTAQKALRDAALTEFKDQNKYGTTGECAVAFAQCMQTTAECGSDYTGCVTLAAKENVASNKNGAKAKQTTIKGTVANITLAASTMEALLAKKEICMHVTKQCVNSNKNDAVWNAFLRNAAPALKSAEEVAEQNLRMQCIPTVAECFKTACKSTIDPNDPDGSYDMCLSNPDIYKSLCKVQLEPCLAATGGTYEDPTSSSLWNGLKAALAAMKVDACTTEVKKCITDRCGEDYSGCVGLDTDTIVDMCPVQKLTACQTDSRFSGVIKDENDKEIKAEDEIREYIASIAQGLMVQIDNSMLTVCQKAANDAMMKVCGDTESCSALVKDESLGARTLKYQVCKNGDPNSTCRESFEALTKQDLEDVGSWSGVITGEMEWGSIGYNNTKKEFDSKSDYMSKIAPKYSSKKSEGERKSMSDAFDTEIAQLQSAVNNAVNAIKADPTVTYCMTGREVQGYKQENNKKLGESGEVRFPKLTDQMEQIIITHALKAAHDNYQKKYDELYERSMKEQVAAVSKIDRAQALKIARKTCKAWGNGKSVEKTDEEIYKDIAIDENGVWHNPGIGAIKQAISEVKEKAAAAAASAAVDDGVGHSVIEEKTYKATINTIFNESTGTCTKETISQNCDQPKLNGCKHWEDPKTTTETITF